MLTKKLIIELYKKCAVELPLDVVNKLKQSLEIEDNKNAKEVLKAILTNIDIAKKELKPICQDTGVPIFYIQGNKTIFQKQIKDLIERATTEASNNIPLRPNAVELISGKNIGNKPIIHFEQSNKFRINLLMKGGGSENISSIYSLPNRELKANRDIKGIKKCILDAVFKAQGKGCPPYVIGAAVGGNIEEVAYLSKKQLLRNLDDRNSDIELRKLEKELLKKINKLGIGPLGLGGKTTALGVKIAKTYRHPASFFVGISFGCWALRRHYYE